MDDLIYGLLVVAWVVYGIYSASKKNKAKLSGQSAPSTPQPKTIVENVFESLFQESSQSYSEINSPYYKTDIVEASIDSDSSTDNVEEYEENDYLDIVPEAQKESEIDTYSGTDNVIQSIVIEDENDEIKKSAIESYSLDDKKTTESIFDLRQGIIAQAILERPYK